MNKNKYYVFNNMTDYTWVNICVHKIFRNSFCHVRSMLGALQSLENNFNEYH